ncbi:MAG TPA: glycosyltransferase family 39 protein [Myxococcaceae bacterium]|nr:glycosyltransferase family 39 protein [Myxococcaceae bacterium]
MSGEALDRRVGWGLFAAAFLALLFTQQGVGFTRDESVYFSAAESYARWYQLLLRAPTTAVTEASIDGHWTENDEHPALMKTLFGWSELLFSRTLRVAPGPMGLRLPAFFVAALIPLLIYRLGRRLSGSGGRQAALFAAISFFCVPRQFFHGHLACFDIPVAAMWLLTVHAFVRAQETPRGWLWAGAAWGLAIATKHNALFMPLVLAPFSLYLAWKHTRGRPGADRFFQWYVGAHAGAALLMSLLVIFLGGGPNAQARFLLLSPHTAIILGGLGASGWCLWRLRKHSEEAFRALATLTAMELFGPLIFIGSWPHLWHHPVDNIAGYLAFHAQHSNYTWFYLGRLLREPPFPLEYVVVVTALTVPTSLLLPMVTGFASTAARALASVWGRARAWAPPASWVEVLVLTHAVTSIAIISHPDVPHFGGVKHWFPSMPFLAILAGRSADRAAGQLHAWLSRRRPALSRRAVAVGLFALLLLPGAWATARVHPYGTSSYSELAGGVPGAASLGMQRQFWSNNVTGVLEWINQNARPGERLYLHEVNGYSFRDYQRFGMLRADIVGVGGPQDATMAAYQYHQEFREHELDLWEAFGTTRPSYGLYVDETPQIVVYRRR